LAHEEGGDGDVLKRMESQALRVGLATITRIGRRKIRGRDALYGKE